MLPQRSTTDSRHVADPAPKARLVAAADPFGDDHPHTQEWALHLAAGACLAAGSPELAVVAVRHGLASTTCTRCRAAFLALGVTATEALEQKATAAASLPEGTVLDDGPPFSTGSPLDALARFEIVGVGPRSPYHPTDKSPVERFLAATHAMYGPLPARRRARAPFDA